MKINSRDVTFSVNQVEKRSFPRDSAYKYSKILAQVWKIEEKNGSFRLGREKISKLRNVQLTWDSLEEGKYLIIVNVHHWETELGHSFTVNRYSQIRIDLSEVK